MNPLSLLVDVIPARWRRYVYAGLAVLAWAWTMWQAAHGDWRQFAAGIITALVGSLATANTNPTGPAPAVAKDADPAALYDPRAQD